MGTICSPWATSHFAGAPSETRTLEFANESGLLYHCAKLVPLISDHQTVNGQSFVAHPSFPEVSRPAGAASSARPHLELVSWKDTTIRITTLCIL
jgi:hypothetical protein